MSEESKKLCLLLLVGDQAPGFLASLETLKPLISQWVIHDVSGRRSLGPVLRLLQGIPGAYAERTWIGEMENRQQLLNLLPAGQIGLLLDSKTLVHPANGAESDVPEADLYFVEIIQGGRLFSKPLVVRGGIGAVISQRDFIQVADDDSFSQARWSLARFERVDVSDEFSGSCR